MKLTLYIKEQPIKAIVNASSIRIQLNNDTNDPKAIGTVTANNLELTIDGAKIVNKHIEDGTSGGVGIFEGLPSRLEGDENGEVIDFVNGYLDLSGGDTDFACDNVKVSIVQKGGNDWFKKRKNSFTYGFLASLPSGAPGRITSADWVQVPYIISSIPNIRDLVILTLSGFVLAAQIRTLVKDLFELVVEFIGGVTAQIRAILKIALYVAFLIILIIAMVNLIKELFRLVIQSVKFHAGMRLQTLLEKGAEYMGHKFESTKFDDKFWRDLILIPSKQQSFNDDTGSGILGFKKPTPDIQTGYFNGTFQNVLDIAKGLWNGRELVGDGIIRIERVDVSTSSPKWKIPAIEVLSNRFNSDEMVSNTSIRFSTDLSEANTIDQFKGTFTDIIVEPLGVDNLDMVLLSGERRISLGVAQAKRKETLTGPEQFLSNIVIAIAPLMNTLLKIAPPNVKRRVPVGGFANLFENRKGMMLLSNDFFQVPKVVSMDIRDNAVDNKIKDANLTRLTSNGLYDESYFVDSFVPSAKLPEPNQWRKYNIEDITFCFKDFKDVRNDLINNNLIFDADGNLAKIISLEWNPEDETAVIEYWLRQIYTTNLKEKIITPDGF